MALNIPGYVAGTYEIDASHSSVGFSIRHMMVAKVRGEFTDVSGTIVLAEDPAASSIDAKIDPATIATRNADRDAHLRSGDFFATDEHPEWSFTGKGIREHNGDLLLDGELQMRGITKPVTFELEFGGIGPDVYGNTRAGASAKARIKRGDFDITFNQALEGGGVMLSDDVDVDIEISAVKQ
ncbi:YceI family protein [Humidisolicoccus flavus]|uniref:YceI family protein n=1 Tax=Humidisolicoccus flavus TaxID=3111414 RepID=UPI00324A46C1